MEYRIIQLKDKSKDGMLLNKIISEESGNSIILSCNELIETYFMNQECRLIEKIETEVIDNVMKIYLKYFCYGKNIFGEYWYKEENDIFFLEQSADKDFNLKNRILDNIRKVNENKKETDKEIYLIIEQIDILNIKVKKLAKDIILEYLKTDKEFFSGKIDSSLEKYFCKYIQDNYDYIKKLIQDNWRYKKTFERIFGGELLLTSIGGMYSFYQAIKGDELAYVVSIGTILFGFISYYVSDRLENKMLDDKYREIEKIEIKDNCKIRLKKKK